jgi:hypothetical protein
MCVGVCVRVRVCVRYNAGSNFQPAKLLLMTPGFNENQSIERLRKTSVSYVTAINDKPEVNCMPISQALKFIGTLELFVSQDEGPRVECEIN